MKIEQYGFFIEIRTQENTVTMNSIAKAKKQIKLAKHFDSMFVDYMGKEIARAVLFKYQNQLIIKTKQKTITRTPQIKKRLTELLEKIENEAK